MLGAICARAEAQVLRLSCLYALLDHTATIRRPHLEAALALWDYAEASAQYLFGATLGDPVADELLRLLRASSHGMTRTDISGAFGRHRKAGEIGAALMRLQQQNLACCGTRDTGGRSAEVWYATHVAEDTGAKKAKEAKKAVATREEAEDEPAKEAKEAKKVFTASEDSKLFSHNSHSDTAEKTDEDAQQALVHPQEPHDKGEAGRCS